MLFYAYKPREDGTEPMGTDGKMLFELKTNKGAMRHALRYLGPTARLFTYTDVFDDSTYREIVMRVYEINQ